MICVSKNSRAGDTEEAETAEWQDLLADEDLLPDEIVMDRRDSEVHARRLKSAMSELSDREIIIIRERKLGDSPVTLESLGNRLGVSKKRVRQIEHHALKKIRRALLKEVGTPKALGLAHTNRPWV